jgi:hypothetical protein
MRAAFAIGLVLLATLSTVSQRVTRPETTSASSITRDEAASLVRAFLRSKGYDTKAAPLDVEDSADSDSHFFMFAVSVDTPQRLVKIGSYGVNSRTGDIWELVQCKRITSKAIARKQNEIRQSSGLSSADLSRLRNVKPDCF